MGTVSPFEKQEVWTVLKVLNWTKGYLAQKGVENARLEAEWLLCEVLKLDRVGLYLNFDKPLAEGELTRFRGMVTRRARREPLQYILGTQEFMGLQFEVGPAVLIPRPDTEILVEEALRHCRASHRILDIGTGSGCVAISLAKLVSGAQVWGVDRSPEALVQAQRNAGKLGVTVTFLEGSLFEPCDGLRFDLIVSNPPYISTADLAGLQPEVRDFEPAGALDGGCDGLDFYRAIIPESTGFLDPDGWLMVEVGAGQAAEVTGLFEIAGTYAEIFSSKDHGGIERVVGGRLMH